MPATTFDEAKAEAFMHTVLGDTTGLVSTVLASIGDRLGLFKDLSERGPATSEELARRTGVAERYAREWLAAMTAKGYLERDAARERFALPAEHAPVLAQESGPVFIGGMHQNLVSALEVLPGIIDAFRRGGGVSQSEYSEEFWDGFERFSNGWFENLLVPVWLEAAPDVKAKLEAGAAVADVGAGYGRGVIRLARSFPSIRAVGYDVHAPSVRRARTNAETAGVSDRVTFEQLDVTRGIPERFDVITTFDVVHDAADPRGVVRAIREALNPGGIYLCVDINCSEHLEENLNPVGALLYGVSVLYCMTSSLASGGEGLGTMGLPEAKLREIALEAGFASVEKLPLENPFNNVYVARV